jgi:hypothetical protein
MGLLAIESDPYGDAIGSFDELDARNAVTERVLDELMLNDVRVLAGKVKPEGPVLGLHARGELAPGRRSTEAEVVCQSGEAVSQTLMSSGVV